MINARIASMSNASGSPLWRVVPSPRSSADSTKVSPIKARQTPAKACSVCMVICTVYGPRPGLRKHNKQCRKIRLGNTAHGFPTRSPVPPSVLLRKGPIRPAAAHRQPQVLRLCDDFPVPAALGGNPVCWVSMRPFAGVATGCLNGAATIVEFFLRALL